MKVLLKENVHLGTKRLPPSKRKIIRTRKEIGRLRVVRKKTRRRKMTQKMRKKTHRRKKIWNRKNQMKVLLKENVHLRTIRLPPLKRKIIRTRKIIGRRRTGGRKYGTGRIR